MPFSPYREGEFLHLSILVVIEKDGKVFHGHAPALKGLHVDGKTLRETLANADAAINVYLDSLARTGDPLPVGRFLKVRTPRRRNRTRQRPIIRTVRVRWPLLRTSGAK